MIKHKVSNNQSAADCSLQNFQKYSISQKFQGLKRSVFFFFLLNFSISITSILAPCIQSWSVVIGGHQSNAGCKLWSRILHVNIISSHRIDTYCDHFFSRIPLHNIIIAFSITYTILIHLEIIKYNLTISIGWYNITYTLS